MLTRMDLLRMLSLLALIAGCASTAPPEPLWPDVGACGLAHRPCEDPGRIAGDAEAELLRVQERFAQRPDAAACRFDGASAVLAGLLVGSDGRIAHVRFAPDVDDACREAVRHAVEELTFVPARLNGQPHPSVWTMPFGHGVRVVATHLGPRGAAW